MPMVRPFSLTSTSPLTIQMVRLSASPSLNSVRPAVICLTVTFFASAFRFSRFMPSSGVRERSSSTLTSWESDMARMLTRHLYGSAGLAKFRPSFVGRETRAVGACEFRQARDDGIDAASACISQRTTAKWCKPRSENHAGVDEVGIGHDFLAQHRGAFVGQRQDQPVLEILRRLGHRARGLHGLAVDPAIETFAALAAELLRG